MAGINSYVATPKKRLSAAFVDLLLIGLAAVIVYVVEDAFRYQPDYGALVAVAYFGYHALFMQFWSGQTPGRRAFDIIVIPRSGGALSMTQILLRSALRPVVILLPTAASLKAGTLELNPLITTIALVVEVALMYLIPSRRTVADFVSRCIVVNAPPLQPHRAPAVPMYSATDGEFGYPPRRPADGKDWER
jgi:uncharacterized RDD family membrane protein YckC